MSGLIKNRTSVFRRCGLKILLIFVFPIIYFFCGFREVRVPAVLSPSQGLFRTGVPPPVLKGNLVAQNEGVVQGPWIIESPLPLKITTRKPFTIKFKCLWHISDLCPERYAVVLRGPTMYTPPISAIKQSPDKSVVTVQIEIPEPGDYELHTWADFDTCPNYWRENMKYPMNRGQVMGSPMRFQVSGSTGVADSFKSCSLDSPDYHGQNNGRWISRTALQSVYQRTPWTNGFPDDQNYIYQPYGCKRNHYDATVLAQTKMVSRVLFLGDSILRGSFCTQIWPHLVPSGVSDGKCKFINDIPLYHFSPKDLQIKAADGRDIALSFRFIDHKPLEKIQEIVSSIQAPTHIVTNIGLWLGALPIDEYRDTVYQWLSTLHKSYPNATVIWRTTTDVAPMLLCYSEKHMTRSKMSRQRDASLEVVAKLRAEGMRIFVVDAYAITSARPDTGSDGRHWVIESPEEGKWMSKGRPRINDAENAVLDSVWDIIRLDDLEKADAGWPQTEGF